MSKKQDLNELEINNIYHKISKIESDIEKIIIRYEIKIDSLERQINELKNATSQIEDDYYTLKKEISKKVNDLSLYLKDMEDLIEFKDYGSEKIKKLDDISKKIILIMENIHNRVKEIEHILHLQ